MRRFAIAVILAAAGIGAYYWWQGQPAELVPLQAQQKVESAPVVVLSSSERTRQELLGTLAMMPGQGWAALPWMPLVQAGSNGYFPLDFLLHHHPAAFLESCLRKYEDEINGYSATFIKQERIDGKLQTAEKLHVHFREEPFSVYMKWIEGARLAASVLYVEGENNDEMLAKPRFIPIPVSRKKDGADAKATSRYTIDQFGIYLGALRTVTAMRAAEERGALHIRYEGVYKVPELNNRPCYKFVRSPYRPLEEEGVNELTIFIDQETCLQLGSVLKDANGELIASYFFADVRLNPEFKTNQFQRSGL